jgi:hypothetical protein
METREVPVDLGQRQISGFLSLLGGKLHRFGEYIQNLANLHELWLGLHAGREEGG